MVLKIVNMQLIIINQAKENYFDDVLDSKYFCL